MQVKKTMPKKTSKKYGELKTGDVFSFEKDYATYTIEGFHVNTFMKANKGYVVLDTGIFNNVDDEVYKNNPVVILDAELVIKGEKVDDDEDN